MRLKVKPFITDDRTIQCSFCGRDKFYVIDGWIICQCGAVIDDGVSKDVEDDCVFSHRANM